MKGQLVTSPTLKFRNSITHRCRPDRHKSQRQIQIHKRKKQAWAVDTYIDLNDYYCKDTNTKYKKEEGGVGS